MSRFRQGIFIGLGISLLLAAVLILLRNEQMRRQLSQRLEELRNALPGLEQLKQSAQQAAAKARETGSALSELVQESGSRVTHLAQEVGPSTQTRSTTSDEAAGDVTAE